MNEECPTSLVPSAAASLVSSHSTMSKETTTTNSLFEQKPTRHFGVPLSMLRRRRTGCRHGTSERIIDQEDPSYERAPKVKDLGFDRQSPMVQNPVADF